MDHYFESIPGWFDGSEGSTFKRILLKIPEEGQCVEVGSWLGRSTAFAAVEIINSGKRIVLHAVDTWQGSPSEPEHLAFVKQHGGNLFPAFWENISSRGLGSTVRPMMMQSAEAAKSFTDESLDFVFIDADHTFCSVRSDVSSWLPKLKHGGTIAGHDADRASVIAAVQDVIPASRIVVENNVWSYQKKQASGAWLSQLGKDEESRLPPHLLFVPCVNRPDLLSRAIGSVVVPGLTSLVIDNSGGQMELPKLPSSVCVFAPEPPLTFTQTQNFAIAQANHLAARWLIFMHNDATGDHDLIKELLNFCESTSASSKVGVIFTAYDAIAAFNMDAVRDVGPWDETWRWYYSDIDYYHRMRLRGWSVLDSPFGARVSHEVSSTIRSGLDVHSISDVAGYCESHYSHKWGGLNGTEIFTVPYNDFR